MALEPCHVRGGLSRRLSVFRVVGDKSVTLGIVVDVGQHSEFGLREGDVSIKLTYQGRHCLDLLEGGLSHLPNDTEGTPRYVSNSLYHRPTCRGGGMADAVDSKSTERKLVGVQIPLPVRLTSGCSLCGNSRAIRE